MELIKNTWSYNDIEKFYEYEKTLIGSQKECDFEKKIVNTSLVCYGKTTTKAKAIAKEIKKGNFTEFLEKLQIKTFFDSMVKAFLICSIKDFDLFKKRLDEFVISIDNWASCDSLKFEKYDKQKLASLSYEYLKSDKPFVRRVGVNIYFSLIKKEEFLPQCFDMLSGLQNETEYYVNMCGAWLLCEIFVKYKDKAIAFFENNTTNDFIINKAISKCRDSFRVDKEDKDYLLKYKR